MFHRPALLVLLSISLCGCGTTFNVVRFIQTSVSTENGVEQEFEPAPKEVYGGVRLSALAGLGLLLGSSTMEESVVAAYVLGIDLPLSAVADTVTLPITVPAAFGRQLAQLDESEKKADADNADEESPAQEGDRKDVRLVLPNPSPIAQP